MGIAADSDEVETSDHESLPAKYKREPEEKHQKSVPLLLQVAPGKKTARYGKDHRYAVLVWQLVLIHLKARKAAKDSRSGGSRSKIINCRVLSLKVNSSPKFMKVFPHSKTQ